MGQQAVRRWAVAGMLLAAGLILALAGFSWNFAQETLAASKFVAHTQQVIANVAALNSSVERAESAQRGFIVTRRTEFLVERDEALGRVETTLNQVSRLTEDNIVQQDRLAQLRRLMLGRIEVYRETERLMQANAAAVDTVAQHDKGVRIISQIRPLLRDLSDTERRLLDARDEAENDRAALTGAVFSTLIVVVLLMLPLAYWRIRRDLAARDDAELRIARTQRFEELHAQALTLYNSQPDREGVLQGTLRVLARDPKYLSSAFYSHEAFGGVLRLMVSHAAPTDLRPLVRLGEGPVGLAAQSAERIEVVDLDGRSGFRVEGGLAELTPAAVLCAPVLYQNHLCGVLVIAAGAALDDADRQFIERLCSQWGVALHNLAQMDELNLLAEQLRARGEDIQQKNAELSKADRMKSEFLANMSHELRTPLNAVIGFSEILKDGLVGDLTAEQTEYISDIFTSGKHLLSLINDILDLSKVESGHSPLELEPIDPAQLSGSGMSVMREKASTQHVRLRAVVDPQLGSLQLDMRKAKQIVYNLLANAVKFTPDGGHVTMTMTKVATAQVREALEQRYARVFAPTELEGHRFWLAISVADTGIGIAQEDLQRLFQPFVQIDSSLSRKFAGTGLGLMMVKRLAELHGGGVMVTSERDQGSTFTVWLPWRDASAQDVLLASESIGKAQMAGASAAVTLAAGDPSDPAPAESALVLVVEDDPRAASLIVGHLEGQGYRVALARSAEDGLTMATELQPAVLVLDIILPGIDGWDLMLKLREQDVTRNIPVVIVSITDERRRGFALGASQVLTKPVEPVELLAAISSVQFEGALRSGATVLVVDDDPKAVTLVSKHLEVAGFHPVSAYGGAEALDLLRTERPALVILDLMMPTVSGFDVVAAMRADPNLTDVPVIVLTAKLLTAEDRAALKGRVQQVLEKSEFLPASLLAEVRRSLAKRRLSNPESR